MARLLALQSNDVLKSISKKVAVAGAAAMLSMGAMAAPPAIATEFDILSEPTPTSSYYIDDANVLSKATRSEVNKRLKLLEVRLSRMCAAGLASFTLLQHAADSCLILAQNQEVLLQSSLFGRAEPMECCASPLARACSFDKLAAANALACLIGDVMPACRSTRGTVWR